MLKRIKIEDVVKSIENVDVELCAIREIIRQLPAKEADSLSQCLTETLIEFIDQDCLDEIGRY